MASYLSFTIRDYSDEYSNVQIPVTDIDDTNWVTELVWHNAVRQAIEGLTLGTVATETLIAYRNLVNDVRPISPHAQREAGLRLFYQDAVNSQKGHITIPAPDKTLIAQGGTDEVDLTNSFVAALLDLLAVGMRSKDGNLVVFNKGVLVGRRN